MLFIVACLFIVTRFPGIIMFEIRQYYLSKDKFQNNEVFSDIAIVYPYKRVSYSNKSFS